MNDDFAKHGVGIIEKVRTEKPAAQVVTSLVPRDINIIRLYGPLEPSFAKTWRPGEIGLDGRLLKQHPN